MNMQNFRFPKVVFVPQFVLKALERNVGGFLPLMQSGELHTKISLNYLAYLFCLDSKIKQLLSIEHDYALVSSPSEQYSIAQNLANDPTLKKELDALLVTDVNNNVEETFIIYDTQSNLVCVGIKEGFGFDNQNHQLALAKAVIKHWYMYEKQEVVAQTSLFNTYLKLLSRK